jgi:hypothetical protein
MSQPIYICNLETNITLELFNFLSLDYTSLDNYLKSKSNNIEELEKILKVTYGDNYTQHIKHSILDFCKNQSNLKLVTHQDDLCECTFPKGEYIYNIYSLYDDYNITINKNLNFNK